MNLSYLTKYSLYSLLDIVFLAISLIAIGIFAVSLPFHKMLGVETIQIFQIFFVSLLIFENYSEPFDRLKLLNYTVGMLNLWNYNSEDTLNARLLYNRLGVVR